jgi:hypothetical protein
MEDQLRQVAKPQEPLKLRRKGLAVSTPGYHTPSKVVVIGGGYAGTVAANHLRMRADVDITLVNPRPEFVERIRLHQFVAEPGEATMNYGIWTAGFGVPELAAASGLLSDELGRLLTDETPTSVDDGRITGTEPAVINQAFAGSCVSLGRRAGIRQLSRKDDTAVNLYIAARMAAAIKEATCKLGVEDSSRGRKPGSSFWLKGGPRPEQPASAPQGVTSL